jgi:monofunctional biosynthetic peptidoglycan transglycosylase
MPRLLALLATSFPLAALAGDDPAPRDLFDFAKPEAARAWQAVNDGVMGGVSDGRFALTPDGTMRFHGTLSLENNGGFASVRTRRAPLGLTAGERIRLRVKGDGRTYLLNLYVPARRTAFSYRAEFPTTADAWTEVEIALADCRATSFGDPVPNAGPVDPATVDGLGLMLADKKPGPFALEVAWIRILPAPSAP